MNDLNIEKIKLALKDVYDPEININIMDLGLVYDIKIINNEILLIMTLTSMGCPEGPEIMQNIEKTLKAISPESSVKIELTWEPAWNKNMMSQEAKDQLIIG